MDWRIGAFFLGLVFLFAIGYFLTGSSVPSASDDDRVSDGDAELDMGIENIEEEMLSDDPGDDIELL